MPDRDDQSKTDEATLPKTSLHAYKDGREDDMKGDAGKFESGDPKDLR